MITSHSLNELAQFYIDNTNSAFTSDRNILSIDELKTPIPILRINLYRIKDLCFIALVVIDKQSIRSQDHYAGFWYLMA